jgi:DNA-binding MurR/RpiR family transcriptional regulator
VALDVSLMASQAGVSRDTAHRLLRKAGSRSFREKHRLAEAAGVPSGPARIAFFEQLDRGGGA